VNFILYNFYTILEAQKYMKKLNFQIKVFHRENIFHSSRTLFSAHSFSTSRRIAANVVAACDPPHMLFILIFSLSLHHN